MGGFGWNCRQCTYRHESHAARCQMCGELRVSREEMRSFVTGGKNNGGGGGGGGITSSNGGPGTTSTCSTRALSVGRGDCDHQGGRGGGPASEVGLSAQQRQQHQPPRQHNPSGAHVSNPYAAGRRPRPPTGNGTGTGTGTGTGNVSNPYASSGGNAGACSISNRPNGIGSGIGGAGSVVGGPPSAGPTTGNANANAAIESVSSASARSAAPANPPSQPSRPPGSGECASGGANGNRVSIMNPPPPMQPMQQPAMTNNPYRQQQSVVSRGPSNPYAQSASRNSNNSSSRPPQQRPQQPMQSAGVGAALLANRARAGGAGANRCAGTGPAMMAPNNQQQQQQQQQNPWTVARSNVVTKQNLRYKPGPVPIDEEAVKTWIYPNNRNHPVRGYQLLATETAINHNTLVSLPTGLGKTLIAAATMYNYYRWFPTGKVVFCAPTKPLVSQQLTSCFDIMGVPAEHTAEIMGDTVNKDDRARYWEERRLFFCTPQTIDNDIDSGRCDLRKIVCVVIDEAHRAKGKYAYVKIIQKINQSGANFRVLALSATPGTNQKAIGEVVDNLLISKIFARSDEDLEVKRYIHDREEDVIMVKQTEAIVLIERQLDGIITPYLEKLRSSGAIPTIRGTILTITSQPLRDAQNEYNARVGSDRNNLTFPFRVVCLLVDCRHTIRSSGIGTVRRKLEEIQRSSFFGTITKSEEFQALWKEIEKLTTSSGGKENERAANLKANNPKLQEVDCILLEHFNRASASGESSKVIIFAELRETIRDILSVIECRRPLVRPHMFIGQGLSNKKGGDEAEVRNDMAAQGMKQKQQREVIKRFRQGDFNVLVATSIGEEGLDIGEVDLIVNFTTSRSCTRMIQRMGRTGRKRQGRVISLVSEGKEQKDREKAKSDQNRLNRILRDPSKAKDLQAKLTMRAAMIPAIPSKQIKEMHVIAEAFRMSQVAGYSQKKKRRNKNAGGGNGIDNDKWILRQSQEKQRVEKYGLLTQTDRYSSNSSSSKPCPFPIKLRREYIRKRSSKLTDTSTSGTSSSILQSMESMFLESNNNVHKARQRLRRRKEKRSRWRLERDANDSDADPAGNADRAFASRLMVAQNPSPHKEGADNTSRTGNVHLGSDSDVDANVFLFDNDESVGWNHGSGSKGYEPAPDTSGTYGDRDNVGPLDAVFGSMQHMSIQESSRLSHSVLNSIFAAVDGERRTVLPPPTLDDTTGMYFMEEYQSPVGSEDDASERLDTPTRDDGLLSMGVLEVDVMVDATKPPALDLPLALIRPATFSVCDQESGAPPPIDSDVEDNYDFPQQLNNSADPPNAEGVHQPNNEEVKQKAGGHEVVMHNVDCEIQISIHTDDSSSSSSEGDEIKAEENKAEVDDQACNVDDTDAPADMQVPESVFVPIDLESLRARGVNVNASPPREFRVSIATQDSSSSGSSASSSSSCSKANDVLEGDAENGLQDQDTNAEGDAERISPKSIATTSDPEFPSQSQTSSHAAESVASQAAEQAAASEFVPANFDDEKVVALERNGTANPRTETDNTKNKAEDELEVQMDCSYVAKPASTSLTDSVDCTPLVFRKKCQQTKGAAAAAARRKVLFSPESMTTQESTGMSTGGREIARSTGTQNLNRSTTQGLLDTPDKSTVDNDEDIAFCGAGADGDRTSNGKSKPPRKRRIRKKKMSNSTEIDLTSDSPRKKLKGSPDKKPANTSGKDKLRDRVSIFFDTEAAIDSGDEDGSDEEKELRALEDDELSHDSFINDSSQLGSCSQDDLDMIRENIGACAPRNDASNAALHRELDARREREQEFATPMLNRRKKNRSRDDDSMGLSQTVDSAQRGLGNMTFIRSVLEHHKAGGDCDQIEVEYHRLAQETEVSNADNDHQESQPQPNKNDSARASTSAAPVHQQAPGQGQQSSTGNASSSSSSFVPRQKSAAAVPVVAAPAMQSAPLGHDLWEAHATANRREAGIAIPTNALNKGRPALATNPLAMHRNESRPNSSNHLIHFSAPSQPPRTHGAVIGPPFPAHKNTQGPRPNATGRNAGLAPAASTNRPAQSSGGKGTSITEEQRARMEENRRKALLRKQQRQQQQHQG